MKKEELLESLEYAYRFPRTKPPKDLRAYNQIVAIIKNQPTIIEKNIKEWAYEAQYRVETHKNWGYVADVMKEMLNEIGVTITKSGK
jgi:TPP-dependent indolepyruvate ferredoxin oxidoreductase alpha subunit